MRHATRVPQWGAISGRVAPGLLPMASMLASACAGQHAVTTRRAWNAPFLTLMLSAYLIFLFGVCATEMPVLMITVRNMAQVINSGSGMVWVMSEQS